MSEEKIRIQDEEYKLIIEKKKKTKNMYLRVKEDLSIYVTCNILYSNHAIMSFINKNEDSIIKMIERMKKKKAKEEYFYYLGKKYDIIYLNTNKIQLGDEKVFVPNNFNLDK